MGWFERQRKERREDRVQQNRIIWETTFAPQVDKLIQESTPLYDRWTKGLPTDPYLYICALEKRVAELEKKLNE